MVIGGGVVGASVLYHLAKAGWRDVVLVERDELTSGSTWHAAGGMHTLNGDPNVAKLQEYTIKLYAEIEAASGQSCGVHITGGVNLAGTPERMDFLRLARARARYLGLEMELITVDEAHKLFPLLDKRHFVGALYNPLEGHVDPAGVTNAYAKAARNLGPKCIGSLASWSWSRGPTHVGRRHREGDDQRRTCRQCRRALGTRGRAGWPGSSLPVLAMEHQYVITGEVPEVVASPAEMLHVIDFEGEIYMRQEGRGMLIGTYEKAGVPWSEHETPWNFTHELLPPDLDRIAPSLEVGFRHFPALERAGIKRVINGPFTFAPDGNPLIGPIRGKPNYWVACGVMAGFSQGGGVGLALANWMVDGDPGFDVWAMDIARFGDWASPAYTHAKVRENYSRRFRIRFPNEELPAARPLRTTPAYERLKAHGAVFGASYGLEHALWFAPGATEAREDVTYRRSNAHGPVGDECRAVRQAVGLLEIATFARYEVAGPGAHAWLDRMLANSLPREGRIALAPMLNERGRLIGDFTVANVGKDRFVVFGSGIAEQYHRRWFDAHLPDNGVTMRSLADEWMGFAVAGPRSRELLARVSPADVSDAAMTFLSFREMDVAGLAAHVGRISFTGELGYEIWVPARDQVALYDAIVAAGADLGLVHFGARALHSLRLEKSFGNWAREYRPIYTPREAGLDRFVDLTKPEFIGRSAADRDLSQAPPRRLCTFVVDAADGDAIGDEPIWSRRRRRRLGDVGRLRALRRQVDRAGIRTRVAWSCKRPIRNRDPRRAPEGGARERAVIRSGSASDEKRLGDAACPIVLDAFPTPKKKKCRCALSNGPGGAGRRFASAHQHDRIVGRAREAQRIDWSSGGWRGRTVRGSGRTGSRKSLNPCAYMFPFWACAGESFAVYSRISRMHMHSSRRTTGMIAPIIVAKSRGTRLSGVRGIPAPPSLAAMPAPVGCPPALKAERGRSDGQAEPGDRGRARTASCRDLHPAQHRVRLQQPQSDDPGRVVDLRRGAASRRPPREPARAAVGDSRHGARRIRPSGRHDVHRPDDALPHGCAAQEGGTRQHSHRR